MAQPEIAQLDVSGRSIAYRLRPGTSPTLLFLPGYASDMEGTKATALDTFADERGLAMIRLDYSGTGSSGGRFEDGTLTVWLEEALAVVDRLTQGPLIVIGSSMGGWLALHVALRRPNRVAALVGIAAAPDFTEWGFTQEQKRIVANNGRLEVPNPYAEQPQLFTRALCDSGKQLLLLDREICVECRVRLIHGDADPEVPLETAFRLMRALRSSDVQLSVLKGGGHRLSEPHELRAIVDTVANLLEPHA